MIRVSPMVLPKQLSTQLHTTITRHEGSSCFADNHTSHKLWRPLGTVSRCMTRDKTNETFISAAFAPLHTKQKVHFTILSLLNLLWLVFYKLHTHGVIGSSCHESEISAILSKKKKGPTSTSNLHTKCIDAWHFLLPCWLHNNKFLAFSYLWLHEI